MNDDINEAGSTGAEEVEASSEQQPDPIKNLKAEYSRKIENVNAQLAAQNQAIEQMLAALNQRNQPASTEKLEDLVYNDPKKYADIVTQRATEQAERAVTAKINAQQQAQAVLTKMTSDYPELNDESSELRAHALTLYAKLDPSIKSSPEGYRIAIREAAADLGVLPSSKRKKTASNDDFVAPSSGSQSSKSRQSKTADIDPRTLGFAEAMGIDINDPKKVERLKTRAQRKNWNSYE